MFQSLFRAVPIHVHPLLWCLQLREDPMHKKWGGFIDILEHDAYCNKVREANPDGFLFDHTVAPGESDCEEDPFANGYLTEDEIMFPEGYTPRWVTRLPRL